MNEYKPDYIGPPGETIADLMDERGISISDLAHKTGIDQKYLFRIMTGELPIYHELAASFEKCFGVPTDFWMERSRLHREFWSNQPGWDQHMLEMKSEFTRFRPTTDRPKKAVPVNGEAQIPFFSEPQC